MTPSAPVRGADIVVTATSSHDPVFDGHWLRPAPTSTTSAPTPRTRGSWTPPTVKRAKFVADLREANLAEAGDILIPIREGAVTADHIHASLGEIVIGAAAPRPREPEEITGLQVGPALAIQDMAQLVVVYAAARRKGIGTTSSCERGARSALSGLAPRGNLRLESARPRSAGPPQTNSLLCKNPEPRRVLYPGGKRVRDAPSVAIPSALPTDPPHP